MRSTAEEKGELQDHSTIGELARFLGMNGQTIERRIKQGKFPAHVCRTPRGWRLWSPEQRQTMLQKVSRGV